MDLDDLHRSLSNGRQYVRMGNLRFYNRAELRVAANPNEYRTRNINHGFAMFQIHPTRKSRLLMAI